MIRAAVMVLAVSMPLAAMMRRSKFCASAVPEIATDTIGASSMKGARARRMSRLLINAASFRLDAGGLHHAPDQRVLAAQLRGEFFRPVGDGPHVELVQALAQLGDRARLIDLAIDAGELPLSLPSTVIDTSSGEICILREGAIPASQVWKTVE